MQLFYLDRMLLAVVCLVVAWCLAHAVDGPWAKIGALTCVESSSPRSTPPWASSGGPTPTHAPDGSPARRPDLRRQYIVMGHSHRMVEEPVGNSTRYFNLARGPGDRMTASRTWWLRAARRNCGAGRSFGHQLDARSNLSRNRACPGIN